MVTSAETFLRKIAEGARFQALLIIKRSLFWLMPYVLSIGKENFFSAPFLPMKSPTKLMNTSIGDPKSINGQKTVSRAHPAEISRLSFYLRPMKILVLQFSLLHVITSECTHQGLSSFCTVFIFKLRRLQAYGLFSRSFQQTSQFAPPPVNAVFLRVKCSCIYFKFFASGTGLWRRKNTNCNSATNDLFSQCVRIQKTLIIIRFHTPGLISSNQKRWGLEPYQSYLRLVQVLLYCVSFIKEF